MSKLYDFKQAKILIDKEVSKEKNNLNSADMGIQEDWFWTAEEVWNILEKDLINFEGKNWLGGIDGSDWGTPVIRFHYADGKEKTIDCWISGEMERSPEIPTT